MTWVKNMAFLSTEGAYMLSARASWFVQSVPFRRLGLAKGPLWKGSGH